MKILKRHYEKPTMQVYKLKGAKAGGSRVVMRKVNDDIMNVFRLTGFIDLFEFE